ncbi:AFG1-like ATPase-domain-containing protein [Truncatella angustata]|uniref:AFG1-like ATPase-domain-containing protein n=1 Tax=Truncatella angustata TaxID=152316 RepID=A0A9P8UIK1_9PEZI|nr:AFG1-like ATPase-domain-containing protein [Truncatella angustata]KAH6652824.1 AFG1-like ATPase-domain-containing protein [Truncatella angustata]
MKRATTSAITITDPLVKYQSLIATGLYSPDPAQHRLAIHLQKIYQRLKDYSPSVEYRSRLQTIQNALEGTKPKKADDSAALAVESHPIRRNPFFARFFARTESKDTLALTRVLESHEAAISINSPQGLFLSGEVGTGKSMLLDLLADGLPTSRKKRWHFNTFMLYTISQLERHRRTNSQLGIDDQFSLLWMAKEMIEKSPVLFLDEFQLPDRAASKILSNLFTAFFQLGGVLVASSNRMPEELEKATGFEYVPPTTSGLIGRALGLGPKKGKGELFGSSSDFANFLEVLKARCEFWQMEGGRDWRRREAEEAPEQLIYATAEGSSDGITTDITVEDVDTSHATAEDADTKTSTKTPKNYSLIQSSDEAAWDSTLMAISASSGPISWTPATLTVYGRKVHIPRQHHGIVYWNFNDLVSSYGPADYITMASTFHTFVIDRIPVLTVLKKNEARRLITLLDALYEARCKLVVRAEVGPDELFFPEAKAAAKLSSSSKTGDTIDADAILPETIAEVYQDVTSPFRPNISTYSDPSSDPANTAYDPDVDSDFGVEQKSPRLRPDFTNTGAFTGEDERFAYKRAASRLWELCGARWHARTGDWWCPLPLEARHWEGGAMSKPLSMQFGKENRQGDVALGESIELDQPAGLQGLRVEELRNVMMGERKAAREERERAGDRFARSRGQSNDGFE